MDIKKTFKRLPHLKFSKKSIVILVVLAFFVVIGCILYAFRYDILFMSCDKAKAKKIHTFDTTQQNDVYPYDDKVIVVNNESVLCLDKDGKKVFDVTVKTNAPLVETSGKYILIADRGGSEVYIIHDGKITHNFNTENKIVNCSINSKGKSVFVTSETSYRNVIVIYNSKAKEIYRWKISDYYITDAIISGDGSRLAATYISTDNEELAGGVVMVNINDEKVVGKLTFKGCVFPYVGFASDNSATAIGDCKMVKISKNGKQEWVVDYNGKKLETFGFRSDGTILSFESASNNSTLVSYNAKGKKTGSLNLDFSVNNLDMRTDLTLVVGSDAAIAVDRKCKQKMKVNFEHEVKRGWFKNDKSAIYIMNGSDIEAVTW